MLADAARRTSAATVAALNRQRAASSPLPIHGEGTGEGLSDQLRLLTLEVTRLQRELVAAREQIARLEAENDTFAARAHAKRQYDTRHSATRHCCMKAARSSIRPKPPAASTSSSIRFRAG